MKTHILQTMFNISVTISATNLRFCDSLLPSKGYTKDPKFHEKCHFWDFRKFWYFVIFSNCAEIFKWFFRNRSRMPARIHISVKICMKSWYSENLIFLILRGWCTEIVQFYSFCLQRSIQKHTEVYISKLQVKTRDTFWD